jgi:HlyD family secretion protein
MPRVWNGKAGFPWPWVLGVVVVGVVGAGTLVALGRRSSSPSEAQLAALTVPVETQDVALRIRASGTVQPSRTVNVSPTTSDIVEELYVEQGDRVTQGQVIARMKNDTAAAAVMQAEAAVLQAQARLQEVTRGNRPEDIAQARARVEQAEATVREADAQVQLAQDRLERQQSLFDQGAIAADTLDEATNRVSTTRATLERQQASLREAQENLQQQERGSRVESIEAAQAQVMEAQANLRAALVRYEDTYVRAPFNGIITQRYASAGAFVAPTTTASTASSGTSSAIVAIAEGLEILAEVPEVDIAQIQPGQPVEIIADAYPDRVFEGQVRLVAPEAVVEQNVTLFRVRISLINGQDELRSQMNVNVEFIGDTVSGALVVPTVAIVTQQGNTGVLVPDAQNRVRFRRVTLGPAVGNQTQILSGVAAGDRVFVDLPPGQRLENLNFGQRSEED